MQRAYINSGYFIITSVVMYNNYLFHMRKVFLDFSSLLLIFLGWCSTSEACWGSSVWHVSVDLCNYSWCKSKYWIAVKLQKVHQRNFKNFSNDYQTVFGCREFLQKTKAYSSFGSILLYLTIFFSLGVVVLVILFEMVTLCVKSYLHHTCI